MDLMSVRRRMLAIGKSELYPIETNIMSFYGVYGTEQRNTLIGTATGELIYTSNRSSSTSDIYIPITSEYTYIKTKRLYVIAFYDKDKGFISATENYNNTTDNVVINNIPNNAKYIRVSYVYNSFPKITRTA